MFHKVIEMHLPIKWTVKSKGDEKMASGLWDFLKDDVSWAISVVGIVLVVFAIGSLIVFKTIDSTVLTTGITGITALAGRNKLNGNGKELPKKEVKKV